MFLGPADENRRLYPITLGLGQSHGQPATGKIRSNLRFCRLCEPARHIYPRLLPSPYSSLEIRISNTSSFSSQ